LYKKYKEKITIPIFIKKLSVLLNFIN
jgi:hypothetical protein